MSRAVSPVLGTLLLTTVTLVVAGVIGVYAVDVTPGPAPAHPHQLTVTANASSGELTVIHASGPTLDVQAIDVRILVDDTPLRYQPPVPFSGSTGFRGAPGGPFNHAADPHWESGEAASVAVAGTNAPPIGAGAIVRFELYRGPTRLASAETRAR